MPFRQCDDCHTFIIDQDTTEWELKGLFGKCAYIFICTYSSLIYGTFFVMLGLGFEYVAKIDLTESLLIGLWIVGVIAFAILFLALNVKNIRASKQRMRDPTYRATLKRLGLLR